MIMFEFATSPTAVTSTVVLHAGYLVQPKNLWKNGIKIKPLLVFFQSLCHRPRQAAHRADLYRHCDKTASET